MSKIKTMTKQLTYALHIHIIYIGIYEYINVEDLNGKSMRYTNTFVFKFGNVTLNIHIQATIYAHYRPIFKCVHDHNHT